MILGGSQICDLTLLGAYFVTLGSMVNALRVQI